MQNFLSTKDPNISEINEALLDFGFYHPFDIVSRMYAEYVNHGNYGYGGGVVDQPPEYWADMATMYWLRKWHEVVKPVSGIVEQKSWIENIKEGKPIGKVANGNN